MFLSIFSFIDIGCSDDHDWKDSEYGDGKNICRDLSLEWCENFQNYSNEAKRACPKTCGVCGRGSLKIIISFLNLLFIIETNSLILIFASSYILI